VSAGAGRAPASLGPDRLASAEKPPLEPAPPRPTTRPVVALLGRPNSGKSSLYNAITGGDARVGNFPGITVDILEADLRLPDGGVATVADLPGLYSIEAVVDKATDEGVARGFLQRTGERGQLLIAQVIDSTQLALGLRLTKELIEAGWPLLVIATQNDVLESEGRLLDTARLEALLGVGVLSVSARRPSARDVVSKAVARRLNDSLTVRPRPVAWQPGKIAAEVITDVAKVTDVAKRRRLFTARADAWLLHPVLGPALFLGLMSLLFAAVFLVADPASNLMSHGVDLARGALVRWLGAGLLSSFLADGLLGGAGTVLAFMPQIVILTLAMEVLDASGYLARGAFLVDRLLRLLGLSGRSFLPLLMGHACAIPAISATRIIRDPRERLTTMLVLPLMTCSARIPTYALILSTFFAARGAWFKAAIFVGLYFAGILSGLVASLVLRRTATKGRSLPLVLEMPAYRVPQARVILRKGAQASFRFLREVGTVILAVAAVLWALLTVPMPGHAPSVAAGSSQSTETELPIQRSIAATVGKALEPVTAPLGFDWRINVGLIGSFGAREVMVGTMGVIFGIENANDDPAPLSDRIRESKTSAGAPTYTTRTGLALLAFFVLACQCMSTISAIRRETKTWRWPAFVLAYTYTVAYVAALLVYQVGGLLGMA
jgi:ferrous iron transport protein B